MDVSDGLVGDLRAMMRASGASAAADLRKAPLSAAAAAALKADPGLIERIFCGGDDYEVLCAVPPKETGRFEALAAAAGVSVVAFGTVGPASSDDVFIGPERPATGVPHGAVQPFLGLLAQTPAFDDPPRPFRGSRTFVLSLAEP